MILKKYISSETAIASYDYSNIADGTGAIIFYGGITALSGSVNYNLNTTPLPSIGIAANRKIGANTTANFNSSVFNLPRTVRGTAFVSGEINKVDNNLYVTAQIKKWDGLTETNISSEIISQTANANAYCIHLPVPLTETIIKAGELLRVTIKIDSAAGASSLTCDPSGGNLSPLKIVIPFKVDL